MGIPCFTLNQNVVKENQHKMTKIWPQNLIHEALKIRMCITKSKGNYQELIMTFICLEWNVFLFHPCLVLSQMKDKFGEKFSPMELIQNIINYWDAKSIFDGHVIEGIKNQDVNHLLPLKQ